MTFARASVCATAVIAVLTMATSFHTAVSSYTDPDATNSLTRSNGTVIEEHGIHMSRMPTVIDVWHTFPNGGSVWGK